MNADASSGTTQDVKYPQVITCESEGDNYTAEQEPATTATRFSAEEAEAGMTAEDVKDAAKTSRLVRLTIPSTMSNAEPDESALYSAAKPTDNPGRSVARLAWEVTIEAPEGTLFPVPVAIGAEPLPEAPTTCTVKQIVAFVDALTGWPIGSFLLT